MSTALAARVPAALLAALLLSAACDGSEAGDGTRGRDSTASRPGATPVADTLSDTASTDPSVAPGHRVRLDPWGTAPGRFVVAPLEDGAIRVTTGPPGITWRPQDVTGTEPFRLSATFTQMNAPVGYREAYGIFVGGRDMSGPNLAYTYLLIRGTGEFLVKQWRGSDTEVVVDWTAHEAIRPIEEAADPENTLVVEADEAETRFLVNGALLHAMPSDQAWPVGVAGIRTNHHLDLRVESWEIATLEPPIDEESVEGS